MVKLMVKLCGGGTWSGDDVWGGRCLWCYGIRCNGQQLDAYLEYYDAVRPGPRHRSCTTGFLQHTHAHTHSLSLSLSLSWPQPLAAPSPNATRDPFVINVNSWYTC
jgi:hypothetical protein